MDSNLIFYTSTIRYSGDNRLDISIKSSNFNTGRIFAPTWDLVNLVKENKITEKEYVLQYKKLMKDSYELNKDKWIEFLNKEQLVLCCYCPPLTFCHRYILTDLLLKFGATYKGEI